MRVFLSLLIAACIVLIGFCIYMSIQEGLSCEAKGGKMIGDGNYYTTVTTVNNITTVYTYEGVECSK
ncbi:hypothetical protein ABEY65_27965 [Priestia aryabhattai]|uniref:hypothetical protein n=1 Tax=Priestia aryabhattai TaxID=412384 RepID=UPI003D2D95D3